MCIVIFLQTKEKRCYGKLKSIGELAIGVAHESSGLLKSRASMVRGESALYKLKINIYFIK